jgi:hypothetical protein
MSKPHIKGSIIMYESYLRLTANELHMHLTKQKRQLHPAEITKIKNDVAAMKEAMRVDRITRANRRTEWTKVLAPLRYELNNAKVGRNYNGDTCPHRIEAFDAYIAVMEKLIAMLKHPAKVLEKTPIQMATAKNLPNNGEHWTDWIPQRIKTPISEAFEAIPHKAKAKRKVPFLRTVTPDLHTKAKERLLSKTTKEMQTLETRILMQPTEERQDQLKKMKQALKIIEDMEDGVFIPASWRGIDLD